MVNVWTFDSVGMQEVLKYYSDIEYNFQTFVICLFFIAQWAIKSWIIARTLEFSYPQQ